VAAEPAAVVMNSAFVFAKPHANTPAVLDVIKTKFGEKAINIVQEGDVSGEEIDSKGFIDQHYYAIAEKSTLTSGKDLPVDAAKFEGTFGETWETVVAEGRAFNALEFSKNFAQFQEAGALDAAWDATSVDNKTRVKLGGGFYCGQIEVEGVKNYTFNAFFMTMRGKFTAAGTSIHYYVVEFDPAKLSWADFRGAVLGPTDPANAPADALRGIIAAGWEGLGLKAPCNGGDNAVHASASPNPNANPNPNPSLSLNPNPTSHSHCPRPDHTSHGHCPRPDQVHASASPFEGLAERMNWLALAPADDVFGKVLLAAGVPEETIKKWSSDPQVTYDAETAAATGKAARAECPARQCPSSAPW